MGKSVIIRSNIKEYAKVNDKPLNVATDFYDRLNAKVISLIQEACKRAKENGRNTVMAKDI